MAARERLTAAVGRVHVTPPIGMAMAGYANRGPNTGIHDPLAATALVLGCGDERAAVVACDLLYFNDDHADRIAARIHERCGIPAGNVVFCCSHNHYGPSMGAMHYQEVDEDTKAYCANLDFVLAGLVAEASTRLAPVKIGAGRGFSLGNINRRERRADGSFTLGVNPDGFTDREVILVKMETDDGAPLAALVNYACHGTSLAGAWTLYSADFPGAMRAILEPATGAKTLYIQGATGNMNPYPRGHDYAFARSVGVKLAGEAMKIWASIQTEEAAGLATAMEVIQLPSYRYKSRENAAATLEGVLKELVRLKSRNALSSLVKWFEFRASRLEAAIRSWEGGEPMPTIANRIHAIRFGPVALVTSAGEIFAQIGVEVKKRSPVPETLFAGYTNGNIGYIPVPEAYAEGGYEVDHACRVDPDAAGIVIEGCLRVLEKVRPE